MSATYTNDSWSFTSLSLISCKIKHVQQILNTFYAGIFSISTHLLSRKKPAPVTKSRQMQCGSGILEFCQTFGFPKRDFSQLEKNVYLLAGTQNQDFIFLTSLESNENILPSAPTRTQSKSVELTTVRYSKLPIGGVVNLLLSYDQK